MIILYVAGPQLNNGRINYDSPTSVISRQKIIGAKKAVPINASPIIRPVALTAISATSRIHKHIAQQTSHGGLRQFESIQKSFDRTDLVRIQRKDLSQEPNGP